MKTPQTISLDSIDDADILAWLERQPRRGKSKAIRDAIRAGWAAHKPDALERKIDEILRRLESGVIVQSDNGDRPVQEEPAEAASALDKLGL